MFSVQNILEGPKQAGWLYFLVIPHDDDEDDDDDDEDDDDDLKTTSLMQPPQSEATTAITKKGNQQTMKAPVTIARVFAAFFSLLASRDMCFFSFFSSWCLARWLEGMEFQEGLEKLILKIQIRWRKKEPVFRLHGQTGLRC